ncbi:MAG: hypothetical protein NTX91_00495 [candidate division SR1 bacterium]|nr:hypothetical protein [candidate division SR1 bacterium]
MKRRTKKRIKKEVKKFFLGRVLPGIIALIALYLTLLILGVLPFRIDNLWFLVIITIQTIASYALSSWGFLYRFCGVPSAKFWDGGGVALI